MSEKVLKVLSNVAQGLTETQKAQARSNIGCAGSYTAGTGIAINDHSIINTAPHVKADWNAATGTSAEILNKPSIGNGTLTIQKNGTSVATFSANQSGNVTANITGVGGTDVVTQNNGQGGIVETPVSKLALDTDFNTIVANNTDIGVFAPLPNTPATDKVLSVAAGGDVPQWVNMPTSGTSVETTSSPYTTSTAQSRLSIYDPGSDFGSLVKDDHSNNIGFLLPKHYGNQDLGKVPTVVNDSGYKVEWRDPSGNYPEIQYMAHTSFYASSSAADILYLEDGICYDIYTMTGGSFTIYLDTDSTTTIHSKLYLWGERQNCVIMTIVYEDEAGEVQRLDFQYGDTQDDTAYILDVFARKITITPLSGNPYDETLCRVYDAPCQTRSYFSTDNNDIGLLKNYVEPL